MNAIERIIEFLNVPPEVVEKAEADLLIKLVKAAHDDDMFKVHHLGYELTLNK